MSWSTTTWAAPDFGRDGLTPCLTWPTTRAPAKKPVGRRGARPRRRPRVTSTVRAMRLRPCSMAVDRGKPHGRQRCCLGHRSPTALVARQSVRRNRRLLGPSTRVQQADHPGSSRGSRSFRRRLLHYSGQIPPKGRSLLAVDPIHHLATGRRDCLDAVSMPRWLAESGDSTVRKPRR